MKKGFLDGCMQFIGLDGCFLKCVVKAQLLTVVSKDANNQMYPVAWASVEIESTDSWTWLSEHLARHVGTQDGYEWTFMSDQSKICIL